MKKAEGKYQRALVKVPEVTMYFWIIKVLATTVGETFADYLKTNLGLGLSGTSLATFAALAFVLFFQFRGKGYRPPIYWLAIVLISISGTLITDNLTDVVGISLVTSSIVFSMLLAALFATWILREKTIAIHSIYTPSRESFYWLTILFTFALGTATGDLLAERLKLGYGNSLIVFAIGIGVISLLWQRKILNPVFGFWAVYVLTRPLGASIGDLLSQNKKVGGFGLGTMVTSYLFLALILLTVSYLMKTKKDQITLLEPA